MKNKVCITVVFRNHSEYTSQKKTFENEMKAIEWYMRNYEKIYMINDLCTFMQRFSHFDIAKAIRGKCNYY